MTTVYDVGDPITTRLKLGVTPDGTTTVAVLITAPDGSHPTPAGPVGPANGDEYTAQFTAGTAGDWVATWTVTGTGAGVEAITYYVRPLPLPGTRVVWAPTLSEVADHIPRLTVDTVTPGSAIEYGTFGPDTTPTDGQAQRHIDRAVATIGASVEEVTTALQPLARAVASLRAAASILRAYYRDQTDLTAAAALDSRADVELRRLVDANTATTGEEYGLDVVPLYSFPTAPAWGDLLL